MTGGCAELRHDLGVYVLGAIDPPRRAEVDTHLAVCPACRDELAGLAGLPALLSRVSEEQLGDAAVGAGDTLLDRVLAHAAEERRRTRRRILLAAAAAVFAAVMIVGGGVWAVRSDGPAAPAPGGPSSRPPVAAPAPTFFASDPASHVTAAVGLTPKAWGTAVTAQLSGLPGHTSCRLVAVGQGGERDTAASWYVSYKENAVFNGSTAVQRNDLARFEVISGTGDRLLVIPVGN